VTPSIPQLASPLPINAAPITFTLPNPIKIELTAVGGGSSGSGWLTFFAALATAGVSGWVGYITAQNNEKMRNLSKENALREREDRLAEFEERRKVAERTREAADTSENNKMSIEQRRLAIEMERLGFQFSTTDNETYLAANRFIHEQQKAEAELLRSLSEKLLSTTERERLFALLVLTAYVNSDVIGRLADGGDEIIPTAHLEKLAELKDEELSLVAKTALVRRKSGQPAANEVAED
jgi:hypothetical protein